VTGVPSRVRVAGEIRNDCRDIEHFSRLLIQRQTVSIGNCVLIVNEVIDRHVVVKDESRWKELRKPQLRYWRQPRLRFLAERWHCRTACLSQLVIGERRSRPIQRRRIRRGWLTEATNLVQTFEDAAR
jgi:hypothetical protein